MGSSPPPGGGGGSLLFDGSVWERSWLRGDARGTTAKMCVILADAIGPAIKFGGIRRGGRCWFVGVGSCSSKRMRVAGVLVRLIAIVIVECADVMSALSMSVARAAVMSRGSRATAVWLSSHTCSVRNAQWSKTGRQKRERSDAVRRERPDRIWAHERSDGEIAIEAPKLGGTADD